MILEHSHLDYDGKVVFETIRLTEGHHKPNAMPNEACYLQILQGSYTSISESEHKIVHKNQGILMKCGSYLSRMVVSEESKEYQAVAIHFYPDTLRKIYKDTLPDFMDPTHKTNAQLSMSVVAVSHLLQNCIDSIRIYFDTPSLASDEVIALKTKEIILLLMQTEEAPQIKEIFRTLFSPREYSLKEVVEAHLYLNTTIEELSQLCYMSSSTFKREFKKIFNETPAQYIRIKKLEKAAALIHGSSETITEIAFSCGFTDSSQFSKLFKKQFGVAPSQYQSTK